MKKVLYSEKPSVFQSYKSGAVIYRWNIVEVQAEDEMKTSQWSCNEITVYEPIDKEILTKEVIISLWDNELEKKLINDYNAARNNLYDAVVNEKYITAYNDFLIQRKAIKEQIDIDWNICYK